MKAEGITITKTTDHADIPQVHCSRQYKLKLTDEEIPPSDDTGAAQLTLLVCELVTPNSRKSLRRFFPSIISCILATASVHKAHTANIYIHIVLMLQLISVITYYMLSGMLNSTHPLTECC